MIAGGAEVQALSAGAMQPGLIAVAPEFRSQSGHPLKVTYAIASELRRRVGGGEVADVLLAPVAVVIVYFWNLYRQNVNEVAVTTSALFKIAEAFEKQGIGKKG